ncbi:TRAP transporter substrate-binding protein [Burkholderiaceae bacterium FT117]|uniref:TRAP transporter substrate-binding protein n=1 Tax=Zeimonas sediminis TaxID=2944268 RepID=UPI002342C042|nr:TRAP transporter substrate-binding protein [Zeimonas sediminis]MCM5570252.1 TRAP transporter substrate-binding protein [Zeimonas sediminis]
MKATMKSARRLLLQAAVAGGAAALALPAAAQQIELKLGHVGEPGSLYQIASEDFAKRVQQKLGDKVKITIFGSSQLGGDKEMMQKLKLGTLDMSIPSTVMSSEVELFGMFEMPYLVKDRAHLAKIEKEIFWPSLAPAVEAKGLKMLALWENGYRHITNNKKPITKPEDLAGIKLRVPEGKWRVAMFKAYGANPSPMKFSELFTALQTGVMDGQENPFTQIVSAKLHEVQKYLSLSGHVYAPAYLVAGKRKWEQLPADIRKELEAAARETQATVYAATDRMQDELLGKIKAAGVEVNEVDKDAFIAASGAIYEEFGQSVKGAKPLVDKAIALGKK